MTLFVRHSVRLYRLGLLLLPRKFRRAFGQAMVREFQESLEEDIQQEGWRGAVKAWWLVAQKGE